MMHKSGYVAIVGLPNAGKSTLLNALMGQKLAITNVKPQTTRKRILGILTEKDYQIIFLDTPGIIEPSYLLQEKMMGEVEQSFNDADIILLLIDAAEDPQGKKSLTHEFVKMSLSRENKNIILIINKVDLVKQEEATNLLNYFEDLNLFKSSVLVSALHGFNIEKLIETVVENLPEGPSFYPDDVIANENERFFVSEIIREKILELYREEIPYSTEVIIPEFKERENAKDFISAEIVVERESQRKIIVGKDGKSIKQLGKIAREAVEEFLQGKIFLELRVKVRSKWRSDENWLKNFGYGNE
ncbi:MAG: GTPase Era [Ignavibacterium sp.]|nr:MAG: GTPase Era [Ignavibacterium sp.]